MIIEKSGSADGREDRRGLLHLLPFVAEESFNCFKLMPCRASAYPSPSSHSLYLLFLKLPRGRGV